ncbi:polycystin-1 [Nematostella vectensis]|uniref:polycystin-1 n=1 Tax=Nematostella vectensis TaxID=45351 RepID=UPI0020777557|nr:polycystin-1 [Nematostella vectensis]
MSGSCENIPLTEPPTTLQPNTESPTTPYRPATPVTNLKIKLSSDVIATGEVFMVGLYYHGGNRLTYRWNLSTDQVEIANPFPYAYNTPSIYKISVYASNEEYNASADAVITVQDTITGLHLINPIPPMIPGTTFNVSWDIEKGTNVSFTLSFPNATTPHSTLLTDGTGPFTLPNRYNSTGNHFFSITATNRLPTSANLEVEVIVEFPLQLLTAQWYVDRPYKTEGDIIYLSIGERVTVYAQVASGTNPKYQFDFGERSMGNASTGTTSYNFSLEGEYVLKVKSFNHINALEDVFKKTIFVQPKEAIQNLEVIASATAYGNVSSMRLLKQRGTSFTCNWSFGDGNATVTDIGDLQYPVFHLYKEHGWYTVNVCCQNSEGTQCAITQAKVEIPISGLKIDANDYIITSNTTVQFHFGIEAGSREAYRIVIKSDSNMIDNLSSVEQPLYYVFKKPGIYYVSLQASNSLGTQSAKLPRDIIVQNPIMQMRLTSNSPIKLPGHAIFDLFLFEEDFATNATCAWNFGDGQETTISLSLEGDVTHFCQQEGRFLVRVNCSNLVSYSIASTTVVVHRMIAPVMTLDPAVITAGQYYMDTDNSVQACVTAQDYDEVYIWHSPNTNGTSMKSTNSCFLYHFAYSGHYLIQVLVINLLENMTSTTDIMVQDKIKNVTLRANQEVYVRREFEIFWSAEEFGTDSCFYLRLGDGSADVVFGDTQCVIQGITSTHVMSFQEGTVLYKYSFWNEGTFNVSIRGTNMVSTATRVLTVKAIRETCRIETLEICKGNETQREYTIKKSEGFMLRVKFHYDCAFAQQESVKWEILTVLENSEVEVPLEDNYLMGHDLNIPPKKMPYGVLKFLATIAIDGEHIKDLYGNVEASTYVTVNITPSQLQTIISGDERMEVEPESIFPLDGSESYDPDDIYPTFNLGFRWYCRTVDSQGRSVGCYKAKKNSDDILWREAIFPTNSNDFIRNQSYIHKLEVFKDGRTASIEREVYVSFGKPPDIYIRCNPECTGRLMSAAALQLISECRGCSAASELIQIWEVHYVPSAGGPLVRVEIPLVQTYFGFHGTVFKVRPGILTPGETYIVTHSAKIEGGLPGKANYTFDVYANSPPDEGNCSVWPLEGMEMSTIFQLSCEGWQDTEMPLRYIFNYVIDGRMTIAYDGNEPQWNFVIILPSDTKSDNTFVEFIADIMDSYGMKTSFTVGQKATVRKSKAADISQINARMDQLNADILGSSSNNITNTSVKPMSPSEKVANARQIARLSGSINDTAVKARINEQLASTVTQAIRDTSTLNIQFIDTSVKTLKDVTQDAQKLSVQMQSDLSESFEMLADKLHDLAGTPKAPDKASIVPMAEGLLGLVSSLLGPSENPDGESSQETMEKINSNCLSGVKSIVDGLWKVQDDTPTSIATPEVEITLEITTDTAISRKKINGEAGCIELPEASYLNLPYDQPVGTQVNMNFTLTDPATSLEKYPQPKNP